MQESLRHDGIPFVVAAPQHPALARALVHVRNRLVVSCQHLQTKIEIKKSEISFGGNFFPLF